MSAPIAARALAAAGYLPIAYDNLVGGNEQFVHWGSLERRNISDRGQLDECLSAIGRVQGCISPLSLIPANSSPTAANITATTSVGRWHRWRRSSAMAWKRWCFQYLRHLRGTPDRADNRSWLFQIPLAKFELK